jgi:hypothetical protein
LLVPHRLLRPSIEKRRVGERRLAIRPGRSPTCFRPGL